MSEPKVSVIVAGAGYAGMLATVRLAGKTRRRNIEIILVNGTGQFVERPRLHEFAANVPLPPRPIAEILRGTGVRFVEGIVQEVHPQSREIVVKTPQESRRFSYDYLLYALGSVMDRDSVPGVREHAYTLSSAGPLSAEALREVLPKLERMGGKVVVVGGGPTGIEAAAEFADAYPGLHIRLVSRGEMGDVWGGQVQAYMVKALQRLGVAIRNKTVVVRVDADSLVTEEGETIPFDLCLWAGGFGVPALARAAGLAVNTRGQVQIDPFMRSVSHPEIYAAGDAASPVEDAGAPVRMAAYTALVMGAHAADCLSQAIKGRPQRPLSFAYAGQGIALGRRDAVGFNNYPDDRPNRPLFTGGLAVQTRAFFVRLVAGLPHLERRWPGCFYWPGKGRVKAVRRSRANETLMDTP
ncbi:MAG TPA: FAD-dependent oxidoreductase [Chthonomonadaceae bacterium]|nr:FAD-dependent oxidoreductase [Chthonomonadaceae bacterium]